MLAAFSPARRAGHRCWATARTTEVAVGPAGAPQASRRPWQGPPRHCSCQNPALASRILGQGACPETELILLWKLTPLLSRFLHFPQVQWHCPSLIPTLSCLGPFLLFPDSIPITVSSFYLSRPWFRPPNAGTVPQSQRISPIHISGLLSHDHHLHPYWRLIPSNQSDSKSSVFCVSLARPRGTSFLYKINTWDPLQKWRTHISRLRTDTRDIYEHICALYMHTYGVGVRAGRT